MICALHWCNGSRFPGVGEYDVCETLPYVHESAPAYSIGKEQQRPMSIQELNGLYTPGPGDYAPKLPKQQVSVFCSSDMHSLECDRSGCYEIA
jgi:hypothetical protein